MTLSLKCQWYYVKNMWCHMWWQMTCQVMSFYQIQVISIIPNPLYTLIPYVHLCNTEFNLRIWCSNKIFTTTNTNVHNKCCHLNFWYFYAPFMELSLARKIVYKSTKGWDDINLLWTFLVCCGENFVRASNS